MTTPKTISPEQMAHMIRVYNQMQLALYFLAEFDGDMVEGKTHPFHEVYQTQFGLANAIAGFLNTSKPIKKKQEGNDNENA